MEPAHCSMEVSTLQVHMRMDCSSCYAFLEVSVLLAAWNILVQLQTQKEETRLNSICFCIKDDKMETMLTALQASRRNLKYEAGLAVVRVTQQTGES